MSLVCGAAVLFSLCGLTFQRKIKLTVSRARRSPSPPTVPFEIGGNNDDDDGDSERGTPTPPSFEDYHERSKL